MLQEIGAAEIYAAVMAIRHGMPPLALHTDCQLLVDGFERGRVWCVSYKRAYAEVWSEFWKLAEDVGIQNLHIIKVKGNAKLSEVVAGLVCSQARLGNRLADKAAKSGAKAHPCNASLAKHRVELGDVICEAARWIGRVGQVVSAELGFRDVEEAPDQAQGDGRNAETRQATTERDQAPTGPSTEWWDGGGIKVGHATHRVWVIGNYVACLRCGAYMSGEARRAYRLHAPCGGAPPNPSAALRLRRLRLGHHPLGDDFIGEPKLSRVEGELRAL